MEYRPEDWNVPLEISPLGETGYHTIDKFSYEAGADEMGEHILSLLKEKAPASSIIDILGSKEAQK